ncbi:MAG: hypothetical protein ACXADA_07765 [Candidatus Hodarchaeales archaeon]|jgi:hypothetical protein
MNDRVKVLLMMIFALPLIAVFFGAAIIIPANVFFWLEGWLFIIVF